MQLEGIGSLYKGFIPLATRKVVWTVAYFLTYEQALHSPLPPPPLPITLTPPGPWHTFSRAGASGGAWRLLLAEGRTRSKCRYFK